jgi:predicted short-subunit dehydrogenase-like oxidoreductase (DUF2520 family)
LISLIGTIAMAGLDTRSVERLRRLPRRLPGVMSSHPKRADSEARPSISIIGPGKVGVALAKLARSAGYRVTAVGGRDPGKVRVAAGAIGPETRALTSVEAAGASELVFLTVSDSAIQGVAEELAAAKALRPGSVLVHCSGALTSEILAPVQGSAEFAVASFHPLQTFPSVARAEADLPGSHCFLEGDARALEILENFGAAIGTHCVRIETEAKVLYHASAVIACNYLCALMDAALRSSEAAGIERSTAWPALEPLILSTLENIGRLGPAAALTGPIQRGDRDTVAMHLRALERAAPELGALYRGLGLQTLDLALQGRAAAELSSEEIQALRRLLRPQ